MNINNMLTPRGDKPRQMNRRILKLNGGAFGKMSETERDQLRYVARHKHGNDTHGTPKVAVR